MRGLVHPRIGSRSALVHGGRDSVATRKSGSKTESLLEFNTASCGDSSLTKLVKSLLFS